jgi:hypothetical protein
VHNRKFDNRVLLLSATVINKTASRNIIAHAAPIYKKLRKISHVGKYRMEVYFTYNKLLTCLTDVDNVGKITQLSLYCIISIVFSYLFLSKLK